jgi:hypothetical protein
MDKVTPKLSDVFQANRDRAALLLAKLEADGIGRRCAPTSPQGRGEAELD